VEFDVHLSSDGVPVVIHDTRLARTTSGRGRLYRHTFTELRKLDAGSWFNRRFPARARAHFVGRKIPSLREVLDWVRARGCRAFLEIKQPRFLYRSIEAKVLEEIRRAGVGENTIVISFHLRTLRRLRELDPGMSLGIVFVRPLLVLARTERVKAGTILPHGASATRRLIRRAHRAGLRVIAWGLDEPAGMRRCLAEGADGIITRYPAKLREIRESLTRAAEGAATG
jgi:glycerophosphoryl diester phosphodiesterase